MRNGIPSYLERDFIAVQCADDFVGGLNATQWTATATGGGAGHSVAPVNDTTALHGALKFAHSTTTQEYTSLVLANSVYSFRANTRLDFMARWCYGADDTTFSNGSYFLGVIDAGSSVIPITAAGAIAASSAFSGVGVAKLTTATVLTASSTVKSVSQTNSTSTATVATAGSATIPGGYHTVGFSMLMRSLSDIEITYFADVAGGYSYAPLLDSNNRQIKHRIDASSLSTATAAKLAPVIFCRNGDTTAALGWLDFVSVVQNRF